MKNLINLSNALFLNENELKTLKTERNHFPVLINEILQSINTNQPKTILDCTFGAGGYSEHILKFLPNVNVIALDRDSTVVPIANKLKETYPNNFQFFLSTFANFPNILQQLNINKVDSIIMDLGISTMQLNEGRGFSFKYNDLLSMQMGLNLMSAADFVNKAPEDQIADVIYYYGEDPKAKKIAKAIVKARKIKEITTSKELADIITLELTGSLGQHYKINPATKSFQAIRIYINNELGELKNALEQSLNYLNYNGVLSVVSFHSLEDKIVKDFLNLHGSYVSKNLHLTEVDKKFTNYKQKQDIINTKAFSILTKKPIIPSSFEAKINPPSLSAKLRVAIKN